MQFAEPVAVRLANHASEAEVDLRRAHFEATGYLRNLGETGGSNQFAGDELVVVGEPRLQLSASLRQHAQATDRYQFKCLRGLARTAPGKCQLLGSRDHFSWGCVR